MFGSRSTPNLSSPTVPTRKIFGNTSDENWRHELSRRGAEVVRRTLEVEHTVRTSPVSNNRMKTRAAIAAAEAARNPISGVGHQTTVPRAGNLESHKSSQSVTVAGEAPHWFRGERRARPLVTQTSFEQKLPSQFKPSSSAYVSPEFPDDYLGPHACRLKTKKRREGIATVKPARQSVPLNLFDPVPEKSPAPDPSKCSNPSSSQMPEWMLQNKTVPVRDDGAVKSVGLRTRPTDIDYDFVSPSTVSGDGPSFIVGTMERIRKTSGNTSLLKPVHERQRQWHNNGVGGIRSVFEFEGQQISDSTVSGDMPEAFVAQSRRICPDDLREVDLAKQSWYNGGAGGVKSHFQTDYGQVSDSTVSSDAPEFLVAQNKRTCPDDIRTVASDHLDWYNKPAPKPRDMTSQTQTHYVIAPAETRKNTMPARNSGECAAVESPFRSTSQLTYRSPPRAAPNAQGSARGSIIGRAAQNNLLGVSMAVRDGDGVSAPLFHSRARNPPHIGSASASTLILG